MEWLNVRTELLKLSLWLVQAPTGAIWHQNYAKDFDSSVEMLYSEHIVADELFPDNINLMTAC